MVRKQLAHKTVEDMEQDWRTCVPRSGGNTPRPLFLPLGVGDVSGGVPVQISEAWPASFPDWVLGSQVALFRETGGGRGRAGLCTHSASTTGDPPRTRRVPEYCWGLFRSMTLPKGLFVRGECVQQRPLLQMTSPTAHRCPSNATLTYSFDL